MPPKIRQLKASLSKAGFSFDQVKEVILYGPILRYLR